MMRIGLLSDTHAHLDRRIPDFFASCDEIWHAGDIGSLEVVEQLQALKPIRAVFGNIDGRLIRNLFPEDLRFTCEGLEVFMTHIGGYPGKYTPRVRTILQQNPPGLYICGHSHILKVMPDKSLGLLHINPGACGNEGFHRVKTIVRFSISEGKPHDLEVIELR
jgi:uncharacterized protein